MESYIKKSMIYTGLASIVAIFGFIVAWSSWYVTAEGHADVVKRFSKAIYIAEPGLNFKIPLVDTTTTIEVRTLRNSETMEASTAEQMPITVAASMNWTAHKASLLSLFKDYGSLDQFESRVIDPRFRAIVKETTAKFTAEDTIGKRDIVTSKIRDSLIESCKDLPIDISAVNIENIILPANYLKSIETKQTNKNLADAEVFKLQQQNLEAQRAVNTATAEADSIKVKAIAESEAIKLKGDAEAHAIEAKAKALGSNSNIVALTQAQQWNGVLPSTIMGSNVPMLINYK